jgi:hypothetical protein
LLVIFGEVDAYEAAQVNKKYKLRG